MKKKTREVVSYAFLWIGMLGMFLYAYFNW